MQITEQNVEEAFAKNRDVLGGVKQDYFALLYISRLANQPLEEISHHVAFGNNDFGVDAFWFDENRKMLHLYQFKWTKDHHQFKTSYRRLIDSGFEQIFGNPLQNQNQNQLVMQVKSCLRRNREIIQHVHLAFVFNGEAEAAEKAVTLSSLREDLESKKFLIDQYIGDRQVSFTIEYLSNASRRLAPVSEVKAAHKYTIPVSARIHKTANSGPRLELCFIQLSDLHHMFSGMGQRLFDRNIRASLDSNRAPNKSLRDTFLKIASGKARADEFAFNHNGVAIAAQGAQWTDGHLTLIEPRVLNGAQTISSYDAFIRQNERNKVVLDGKANLQQISVIAKIVTTASEEFVVNTTICTNRQNPVSAWNLRASDKIQLEIQDRFREMLGIYYERQEKAFANLRDDELEELEIQHGKAIELKRFAITLLAMRGDLDRMSDLSSLFESEKAYADVFNARRFAGDLRPFVLAYKVQSRLGKLIDLIYEKDQKRYLYVKKAGRNLVWSLVIQGLFNHRGFQDLCEQYGTSLMIESDFTALISGIAVNKVRSILRDAIEFGDYEIQISANKFAFMKTKTVYSKCMAAARLQHSWEKVNF